MKVQLLVVQEPVVPYGTIGLPSFNSISAAVGSDTQYTVTAPGISPQVRSTHVNRDTAIERALTQIRRLLHPTAEWVEVEI